MLRPMFIAMLVAGHVCATPLAAEETPRQITVRGSAEIEAVPDLATVTAGVETQEASAGAALGANSQAMAAVFDALKSAGIERRDMQTSQFNLSPVYASDENRSGEPPRVVAYQAANMVTVRVRDVGALGQVIDALAGAGANRLYGVAFEVAKPREALDEARRQAVADARAKAELFAGAAGVKLGPVISLSEGGGGGPMPYRAKADMAMQAPPVAEGTVTLGADVEVVYGLE